MRRRSFWKLPLAALAAVVLPQVAPATTPMSLPGHALAQRTYSEEELDAADGTMSGYALEQMRLAAMLDQIRESPEYRKFQAQLVFRVLGRADLIERPALDNPNFSMGTTLRIPHYRNLNTADAWSPVKPDDLMNVVRVDFDSNDVPIAFTAEGDV